ncbi:uncharacterized protein [Physeter macrocephalus]|uniref:Uncharacterized protein n=1 Tax=Physeter macrocephalus TaxID=9755 RepID=A0A2Y9SJD6_PHYMC|nr:uncharacterized protein LOC102984378 [Physeter catodon]|eukprot:XP_023978731.1 uncharacterized protein LOC102984378 [Physeter catodon]
MKKGGEQGKEGVQRVSRRKGADRKAGRGRARAGRAAVALCSPLAGRAFAAGPAPGAAATSVWTQRRKRPSLLPLPGDLLRRHWAQERPRRGRSTLTTSPQIWTAGTTIKLAPPWEGQTDRKTGSSGLRWKQKLNSPGLRRGDQRPAPTPGRWAETRKTRSLWLGPIPPREAPSLPAPRLPTATDAGKPPPPGEGSPGHRSRRCPPSFPPSLPLPRPPSLSPSLARCRSRGPPAGNLFWIKSR